MDDQIRITYSNDDGTKCIERQKEEKFQKAESTIKPKTIIVNPLETYQEWLGFGGIWTDTDLHNLFKLSYEEQEKVLKAYFDPNEGIGWNFIRLPFGSTDWESSYDFYTYDDVPRGEQDLDLKKFSIQRDIDRGLFEVAKRCKAINPDIIFLGSVWGVPAWMKDNQSICFGKFDVKYAKVYAKYLRMTIQAYKEQGIELYAITPQNESMISDDRATPACRFTWRIQKEVILALRKELDEHHLNTQIWAFDDSYMRARIFVEPLLNDQEAKDAIDGIAYHSYNGSPEEVGRLTRMYPDVPSYHTERSLDTTRALFSLVCETHNYIKSHINWSILEDEYGGPHQFKTTGKVLNLIDRENRTGIYVYRDLINKWGISSAYGLYGQFTKYIKRGMKRIASTMGDRRWVSTVSFMDEATGDIVTVVVNENDSLQQFDLRVGGAVVGLSIPPHTVATYCYYFSKLIKDEKIDVIENATFGLVSESQWDISAEDILIRGALEEGAEIQFGCRMKNVGEIAVPRYANYKVEFSLDGITNTIALAMGNCKLKPNESQDVWCNIPVGKDITWKAEKGYHDILMLIRIGGDITDGEHNFTNNFYAKEILVQ